jgi:hypothetical protein
MAKNNVQNFSEDVLRRMFGSRLVLDRNFQFRYTFAILGAVIGATLPVVLISLYFLNNNYNTFIDLALNHSPDLTNHLIREKTWVNLCIFTLFLAVLVFTFFFGLKVTNRLIAPILIVREHIKSLSRGHWDAPDIVPTEDEEYYDLVEAYHYFYKSLKHLTKSEIERLRQFRPEMEARGENDDVYRVWKDLIQEKTKRLNL